MTYSKESHEQRTKRLADGNVEFAYRMGRAYGQAYALKRAITLLTFLEKTSGSIRPGVTESLKLVKEITIFEHQLLED